MLMITMLILKVISVSFIVFKGYKQKNIYDYIARQGIQESQLNLKYQFVINI